MLSLNFRIGLLIILSCTPLFGQKITQTRLNKTRILFLVDGSNSMFGTWEETLKIDAAKTILNRLVDSLRVDKNLELALRIYGHRFDLDNRNCEDTKLEVGFSPSNHDEIISKISALEPKGTTPIAYSLTQAADDFPETDTYRNIVIIITDGVESCGGDPCKISEALQRQRIFLKPFIIGLSMDENYQKEFDCLGTFFDAREINDFRKALDLAIKQSLSETTVSVELLDDKNEPTETNVNISFINHLTGESEYEFVHFRDPQGKTDSIQIEPVLTYDIIANTIPPVTITNIDITGGQHNVISLTSPQGFLRVNLENASRYEKGVEIILRKKDQKDIIHIQNIRETGKYLKGIYDLEVLTLPKIIYKAIQINYRKTTTIDIEGPGLLNVSSPSRIYATIYLIEEDRKERWVINLDTKNTTTKLAMQSGSYKIAYRSKNTFGSKFTEIKYFKIRSKIATTLKLFE